MIVLFSRPSYLWFLLIIPVLFFLHFYTLRRRRSNALLFSNFESIEKIRGIDLFSKNISILILSIFIVVCVVFSLSGMKVRQELFSSSQSYVLAIDSSKSMEAGDIPPNRLEAAKSASREFISLLPYGTRLAVISFAGSTVVQQDLSEDRISVRDAIDRIEISSVGGTDLYETVLNSANLLRNEEGKALVILSDGRFNIGNVPEVIQIAQQQGLVIYAIALGTAEGGSTSYGISSVEEDTLRALSYNTGGVFYSIVSGEELRNTFQQIRSSKLRMTTLDMSRYLMFCVLFLSVALYILTNTRFSVFP